MSDEQEITGDFLDKPLPKGGDFGPMELLPEREWLRATILEVKCIYAMFNGQIQYLSTKNEDTGEEVFTLDKNGQKIPRAQFKIVYGLKDYTLDNGNPRKGWTYFGATYGEKAHLPKYLLNLSHPNAKEEGFDPTAREVINFLVGKHVFVQFAMKISKDPTKESKQNIVKEAIKLDTQSYFAKDEKTVKTEKSPFDGFASENATVPEGFKAKSEPAWDD